MLTVMLWVACLSIPPQMEAVVWKHSCPSAQSNTIDSTLLPLPSCSCWDSTNSLTPTLNTHTHTHTHTHICRPSQISFFYPMLFLSPSLTDTHIITSPNSMSHRPWAPVWCTTRLLPEWFHSVPGSGAMSSDRKCCWLLILALAVEGRCRLIGANGLAIVPLPVREFPQERQVRGTYLQGFGSLIKEVSSRPLRHCR